jgi:hypothetical protein
MREMRVRESTVRSQTPLIVRGSLPRVFLSLGIFIEAGLLFCGSYLLADAILQPLNAGTFSVVGGGMFLGLATVLLFYLAWPSRSRSISHRERPTAQELQLPRKESVETVETQSQPNWITEKKPGLLRPM